MNWLLEALSKLFKFDSPEVAIREVSKAHYPKKKKPRRSKYLTLRLDRDWFSAECTTGKLTIDYEFECYTLEDEDKLQKGRRKVYGETAIPRGTYDIDITYSPRFKTKLPVLRDVPNFKGIRIHPGNTAKDTEGCILVGETRSGNFIGRSRSAFKKLYRKLEQAKADGRKIRIIVK